LLDNLINGMLNVIYLIAAGGLLNMVSSSAPVRKVYDDDSQQAPVARSWRRGPTSRTARTTVSRQGNGPAEAAACSPESRERLAARYRRLGRALKDHGRPAEAKTAWLHALDLLTEPLLTPSSTPSLSQDWCDCANDLAWLFLSTPDPAVRDPASAVALAAKAAAAHPECSVYWNTLGAAHYRAGNFETTIAALDRATALSHGGTAFDHVFLAMAYAQMAKYEQAHRSFDRATHWMERYQLGHPELLRLCDEARSILSTSPETSTAAR
jgi:tetratricopeptide (TPR) repeat protein